jgi:hypothetical protein
MNKRHAQSFLFLFSLCPIPHSQKVRLDEGKCLLNVFRTFIWIELQDQEKMERK